jgi:hypothetical protein
LRAEIVALTAWRQLLLVRAPAELGRLAAFADEAIDRPGVDELAHALRHVCDLRVALGDVDHLHLQLVRECRPLLTRARIAGVDADVRCEIQQRLLDEVRHQTGIRAVRQHGSRTVLVRLAQGERFLAQRVIGTPGRRDRLVGVATGPRLDAGVEIQRALLVREFDQRDARNIHRQVQQEVAFADQRLEHLAVVVARERVDDELDAVLRRFALACLFCGDDGDAFGLDADVTQHERQHALPDAAETYEDQTTGKLHVNRKIGHGDALAKKVEKRAGSLLRK